MMSESLWNLIISRHTRTWVVAAFMSHGKDCNLLYVDSVGISTSRSHRCPSFLEPRHPAIV